MPAARTLITERLDLRWLDIGDAAFMLSIWNDPAFVRYVGDRGVRTVAEAEQSLAAGALKLYSDFGYGPYCVALRGDDASIGICGLFKREHLDAPDIGFAFLPAHCRNGYAYESASAVLSHTRDDLGLDRVTAIVSPENAASIGLIEKLGMQEERRMRMPGEDHDVLLYGVSW